MALDSYTPKRRELILLYGAAGRGKTRLATSLTERFGDVIYFAVDEGSEDLDSVMDKYRGRISVIKPSFTDPLYDAAMIASTNWKIKYPNAKTIVIDTFTSLSGRILTHATNKGLFQSKHNSIGIPGTDSFLALSDKGDIGGTHGILKNFIVQIIEKQPEMNLILICHEYTKENDEAANEGGPATVGKALISWLPSKFKTVIRMDVETESVIANGGLVQKTKFVARTAPHGIWIARINENSAEGNPMPKVAVNVDARNVWEMYDRFFLPKEAVNV
jgi:hypothetical protein